MSNRILFMITAAGTNLLYRGEIIHGHKGETLAWPVYWARHSRIVLKSHHGPAITQNQLLLKATRMLLRENSWTSSLLVESKPNPRCEWWLFHNHVLLILLKTWGYIPPTVHRTRNRIRFQQHRYHFHQMPASTQSQIQALPRAYWI